MLETDMDGGTSHPAWGAWIEIPLSMPYLYIGSSRTPHGVRGLKFFVIRIFNDAQIVAPRMGCVD